MERSLGLFAFVMNAWFFVLRAVSSFVGGLLQCKKCILPLDGFRCFRAYSFLSNVLMDRGARFHVRSGTAYRVFLADSSSGITLPA
jgi:hypothetical protein